MWPWIKGEAIYAAITDDQLMLMQYEPATKETLKMRWHERLPIQLSSTGLLQDMPGVQQKVKQILQHYKIDGQALHFLLMPPLVTERLVVLMHHTASLPLLAPELTLHEHYWYQLLGPYEDQYLFYVAHAARALLLQLELLVIDTPVYLASMRVRFLVQKNLYQLVKGLAYRQVEQAYAVNQESIDLLHHCASLLERMCNQMQHNGDELFMHVLSMRIGDQA